MKELLNKFKPTDIKVVYEANGLPEAELIKNYLVELEIEAFVIQESVGVTYGLVSGPLGIAKVYVRKNDFAQASEVINNLHSTNEDLTDYEE
ncbi:MAG: DUF2007 domain-containing protein [Bacteroidales bacterium]|nr:DUF2007 domain-containing protein [Bacteroidales bacterium]